MTQVKLGNRFVVMEQEIWKPVAGHESYYSVSDHGRVRREKRSQRTRVGYILKNYLSHKGYWKIGLYSGNGHKCCDIHRLIAVAFLGPCPDGLQVNHKNGIKTDNRPANLEYVTAGENLRHARMMGLTTTKLTSDQVNWIRRIWRHGVVTQRELAECFLVSAQTIGKIVHWRTWRTI